MELEDQEVAQEEKEVKRKKISLPAAISVGFAVLGSVAGPFAVVGCAVAGAVIGRKLEEKLSNSGVVLSEEVQDEDEQESDEGDVEEE